MKLTEDINSGQYDDKDDFTVVLQPFLQETPVPMTEVKRDLKLDIKIDVMQLNRILYQVPLAPSAMKKYPSPPPPPKKKKKRS